MIQKPDNVRPVCPADEGMLFDLLCMAYRENAPYRINEDKVRRTIAEATRDRTVIVGVIDAPDGGIAGSIGAFFSQWWYTDDWHIEECWNFVHPDHRRSAYANNLLDYVKWISDNMEMPAHIGILTAERLEAKERLYGRKLQKVGSAYAYNINMAYGPIAKELPHG